MKHSYETGVNKKWSFSNAAFRFQCRMIKSWKFYLTIAFIAVLTFLSIYPGSSRIRRKPLGLLSSECARRCKCVSGDEYNSCRIAVRAQLLGRMCRKIISTVFYRGFIAAFIVFHVLMTAFGGFLAVFWDIRSALG